MSINSDMKLYDIFEISYKDNILNEKIKYPKKIGSCLVSIHEKSINFIDNNNVYKSETSLVALTRDTSIKKGMVIKINDKFFDIKHIKPSKRFFSLQLKETSYDKWNY